MTNADALDQLGKRAGVSDDLARTEAAVVADIRSFSMDVKTAADFYRQADQAADASADERYRVLTGMEETFEQLDGRLVAQFDAMDAFITKKREDSVAAASSASTIARVCYVIGLCIGGLGKWFDRTVAPVIAAALMG